MFKKLVLLAALGSLVGNTAVLAANTVTAPPQNIEVTLTQHELGVDVSNTGSTVAAVAVGGILGALIGAAINKANVATGEKRVGELRDQLVDYNFNERFEQALRAKLAAANLTPGVEFLGSIRGSGEIVAAGAQARTNLLQLAPRYSITANFENLAVSSQASWVDRTLKSNGKVKVKVHAFRTYAYRFPMQKVGGSGAVEDAQRWVALGAPELTGMIDAGIDQVTDMIVYDMTPAGIADAQVKAKSRTIQPIAGRSWTRTRFALEGTHAIDGKTGEFAVAVPVVARAAQLATATPAGPVADEAPAADVSTANVAPVAMAPATEVAPAAEASPAAAVAPVAPATDAPAAEPALAPASSQ